METAVRTTVNEVLGRVELEPMRGGMCGATAPCRQLSTSLARVQWNPRSRCL